MNKYDDWSVEDLQDMCLTFGIDIVGLGREELITVLTRFLGGRKCSSV